MYKLNGRNLDKKSVLLKQERKLFHANDLALLWGITNKNTLYTTIKRYKQNGVLIPIHKGFYSVAPLLELDPIALGVSYLHSYVYLSTETILAREGIIAQAIPAITLISNTSKKFELAGNYYVVRKMKDEFLYNDLGIVQKDDHREATVERAVADLLYFNPKYHFDNREAINWAKVKHIQKEVGLG